MAGANLKLVEKESNVDRQKALDAAHRFSRDGGRTHPYRGQGVRIPTLEEALALDEAEGDVRHVRKTTLAVTVDLDHVHRLSHLLAAPPACGASSCSWFSWTACPFTRS